MAGFLKNIKGDVYVKWKINKAFINKSYSISSKSSKKLNKKIKLIKD